MIEHRYKLSLKWKIFKEFLLMRNALIPFLNSYDNERLQISQEPLELFLKRLEIRCPDFSLWIDQSMFWAKTKEGEGFWSPLHTEFRDYCRLFTSGNGSINVMSYLMHPMPKKVN